MRVCLGRERCNHFLMTADNLRDVLFVRLELGEALRVTADDRLEVFHVCLEFSKAGTDGREITDEREDGAWPGRLLLDRDFQPPALNVAHAQRLWPSPVTRGAHRAHTSPGNSGLARDTVGQENALLREQESGLRPVASSMGRRSRMGRSLAPSSQTRRSLAPKSRVGPSLTRNLPRAQAFRRPCRRARRCQEISISQEITKPRRLERPFHGSGQHGQFRRCSSNIGPTPVRRRAKEPRQLPPHREGLSASMSMNSRWRTL